MPNIKGGDNDIVIEGHTESKNMSVCSGLTEVWLWKAAWFLTLSGPKCCSGAYRASVLFFAKVAPDAHCKPAAERTKLVLFTAVHRTNNQPEAVASVGFMPLCLLLWRWITAQVDLDAGENHISFSGFNIPFSLPLLLIILDHWE